MKKKNIKKERLNIFKSLLGFFAKIRIGYLSAMYFSHLWVRMMHDKKYEKGGWYKKYSDKKFTSPIHKTVLVSFILSFVIFQGAQQLFPYLNLWKPREVKSAANSVTWTTKGDFSNNETSTGSPTISNNVVTDLSDRVIIDSESNHNTFIGSDNVAVAIKSDGTAVCSGAGVSCLSTTWNNLIEVSAGRNHIVGLKSDGTIVGSGSNLYGQLNFGSWPNLKSVSAYLDHTVAITETGTVVYVGGDSIAASNLSQWTNVKIISTGGDKTVGLNESGNVLGKLHYNGSDLSITTLWSDIISIKAGDSHVIGLKNDGTVVAEYPSNPYYGGIDVGSWSGVKQITVGRYNTFALTQNGELLVSPSLSQYAWDYTPAQNWTGIEYISASRDCMMGLDNSGNIFKVGYTSSISNFIGIKSQDNYYTQGVLGGLKINGGSIVSWSTISWNGTEPVNTNIKFRTRGANTELELTTAEWSGYYEVSGSIITSAPSQWLEVELTLESIDGISTPILNDFTITYDTLEAPTNANIVLTKTDATSLKNSSGTTVSGGVPDAWSNESTLRVTANNLTCTGCVTPENIRPEVEIEEIGTAFDSSDNIYTAEAGNNYVDITSLTNGSEYHLQVRAIDDQGRVSGWTAYGANEETSADITIDQSVPTGNVVINGGAYANSQNVTLDTSSAVDIGGSNLGQMRFSNDGVFDTEEWEAYAASKSWNLTSGEGEKTVYAQYRDNAGNVSGTWLQTSDDDFAGDTLQGLSAENGNVTLSPVNNSGWIYDGLAESYLEGKQVYSQNLSERYGWGLYSTNCSEPQCSLGIDPAFTAKMALNASNAVDYSDYPARNACSVLGGRLPYYNELHDLYVDSASYGNNFGTGFFWSATQTSDSQAIFVTFSNGGLGLSDKTTNYYVRCVRDIPTNTLNYLGLLNSEVFDSGQEVTDFGVVIFNVDTTPANTAISIKARAGNTAIPDGTWTGYYTLTSGEDAPSELDNHQYLQYKATLTGDGNNTPTFYDIQFDSVNVSDSIILDLSTPTLSGFYVESSGGSTEYITEANRLVTTKGVYYDNGNNKDLKVQFSQDGTNWGTYSGSGTTNNKSTDWTYYETINPHEINVQTITDAWYLEGSDGAKEIYIRVKDEAGNVAGEPDLFADDYIDGPSGTVLDDKQVYHQYLPTNYQWKSTVTSCTSPQCEVGLDAKYPTNYSLVESSSVDFSAYPAQNACQLVGGRLPYYSELSYILNHNVTFDLDFTEDIWIATESSESSARYIPYPYPSGSGSGTKTMSKKIICVRTVNPNFNTILDTIILDTAVPTTPQTFSVSQNDTNNINLSWSYNAAGSAISNHQIERVKKTIYEQDVLTPTGTWSNSQTYALVDCAINTSLTETITGVSTAGCTLTTGSAIEQSVSYYYRIRAKDLAHPADWGVWPVSVTRGLTVDGVDPVAFGGVTAVACDGTSQKCSNIANKGYEIKLTWNATTDAGSGVTGYKIYRKTGTYSSEASDYVIVGYIDINPPKNQVVAPENPITTYYDNDTNNDATFTDVTIGSIKSQATTRLNDYVDYFYRVTAVDDNLNETDVIASEPGYPLNMAYNSGTAKTTDKTPPSTPTGLSASAIGVDNTGETQGTNITWSASTDTRTIDRIPTGNGSGIKNYKLYRATSDQGAGEQLIYTGTGVSYSDNGLTEDTYFYYRVSSTDNADLTSVLSTYKSVRTKNSQVPTSPSNVTVQAVKGDPNTDSNVGNKINITFLGSKIKVIENSITDYKIYRSTINYENDGEWEALTPIHEINNLSIAGEIQDIERSYTDTVEDDATTYYYKIIAYGLNVSIENDPGTPENEQIVKSGLSSIGLGTHNSGWDTVPDITAPDQPQEVTVKNIHANDSMVRNIVTWQMISDPQRNSQSDFSKYEVWRFESTLGIASATKITEKTDIGDNYHVDGISIAEKDKEYSYYVISVDDAGTDYKYADETVINNISNRSTYQSPVSINPGSAIPIVSNINYTGVGVSSATITWSTDQQADSLVEYRIKDTNIVIAAGKDRTTPVTSHTINLLGLEKGKTYEYRIVSRNSLGNIDTTAANTWKEFKTQDFSISGITVEPTTTTAKVKWTTNINADSSVEYKRESSSEDSQTAGDPALLRSHEVVIKSLKPATTYTYKIRSVTEDKYIANTQFATFSTKPFDSSQFVIQPDASNIAEENITATSAKIVWNTLIATTTWVDFGTKSEEYGQSAGSNEYNTVHVVELKNLTPGTTYFYKVRGLDINDVEYTSKEYKFTAVLKPEIQNLKINLEDPYLAVVTFTTNVETESSVSYGEKGKFDQKAGVAQYSKIHQIELKNLTDGTTYAYYVEVKDKIGNSSKSSNLSFETPIDKTGPEIDKVKIDILPLGESDEYAQAIISWSTNKPATTKIEYDEGVIGGKYGKASIEDESLNNSHTVIIKDLNPASTYHFRIVSKDKRLNQTKSSDYTFVTPSKEKSILQLILKSLEETFSWTRNVGSFFSNLGKKTQ